MERIHPDGLFEAVFPDRPSRSPYRLAVENHEGHCLGVRRPLPVRARSSPTSTSTCWARGRTTGTTSGSAPTSGRTRGSAGVHFAVWAPNAQRVSVVGNFNHWDGRRHPMRNRGADGHLGDLHPRPLPGRGLQVRDQEPAPRLPRRRSPTPTASPPSCGPRPRRSSGTSPSSTGTTRNGWQSRAAGRALDAPIVDLRGPPRLVEAEGRGGEPLPQLPRAGRRPGRAPRATRTSPTSS